MEGSIKEDPKEPKDLDEYKDPKETVEIEVPSPKVPYPENLAPKGPCHLGLIIFLETCFKASNHLFDVFLVLNLLDSSGVIGVGLNFWKLAKIASV